MSKAFCPNCGDELTHADRENESDEPRFDGHGVGFSFKCGTCGKTLEEYYNYSGIWDPENQEYVYRD